MNDELQKGGYDDRRHAAGKFLYDKGVSMKSKLSPGVVQGWLVEFAASENARLAAEVERLKAESVMRPRRSPLDYIEDYADEDNGCYQHKCDLCGEFFYGHKRRTNICKACHLKGVEEALRSHRAVTDQMWRKTLDWSFDDGRYISYQDGAWRLFAKSGDGLDSDIDLYTLFARTFKDDGKPAEIESGGR